MTAGSIGSGGKIGSACLSGIKNIIDKTIINTAEIKNKNFFIIIFLI
jgi:hypothetical protein